MKRRRIAHAAPVRGVVAAENKGLVRTSYRGRRLVASPAEKVITKQLTWALLTLRNPRIRSSERECVLDLIGQILLGFLGRDAREVGQ